MNKKWLLILAVFLVSFLNAAAEPITIEMMEAHDEVEAGSNAQFQLKVTNNQLDRDVFNIESDEFNVYPFSEFAARITAKPSQVKLDAEESALVDIIIKTLDTTPPNRKYNTRIKIGSLVRPGVKTDIILSTVVVSAKNIVEIKPELPYKLTPGKEIIMPIKLKNRAQLTLENLEIMTTTNIPKIAESLRVTLKPREEKTAEITINIDPAVAPGERKITIAAYEKDQLRGSYVQEIFITPKERVEEETEVKRGFLSSTTTITKINKGNAPSEQRMEANYNIIQRIFTTMNPAPTVKKGKVVWEFTLDPGEEKRIEIAANYRPALYGVMIIVIFTAIFLFWIERSVVIKKRSFKGKDDEEGKEYKIILLVRNGRKYPLSDVRVMDLVPLALNLTTDFGSLKPDRIQHGERSTRLMWNIAKLESGEERVFSYKIRLKKDIVGEVTLPTAIAQYRDKKDRFMQVTSMRLLVNG